MPELRVVEGPPLLVAAAGHFAVLLGKYTETVVPDLLWGAGL